MEKTERQVSDGEKRDRRVMGESKMQASDRGSKRQASDWGERDTSE